MVLNGEKNTKIKFYFCAFFLPQKCMWKKKSEWRDVDWWSGAMCLRDLAQFH